MTVALTEKRLQVNFGTYRVPLIVTLFGLSLSSVIVNWMSPFPHASQYHVAIPHAHLLWLVKLLIVATNM